MNGDAPIKVGQFWTAKDSDRLKSSSQIEVKKIDGERCIIERYYTTGNKPHHKKDRITFKGLRKYYTLVHEQETLL